MEFPALCLLQRDQINDALWNECIELSSEQVVYGFSWYLDETSDTWEAIIAIGPDGSYLLACPLPVRFKIGFRILYQPHFCQYLGIFSTIEYDTSLAVQIFEILSRRFRYVSGYSFNPQNTVALSQIPAFAFSGFTSEVRYTHWLDLSVPYSEISGRYHPDRKRNLKKAIDTGWQLSSRESVDGLIRLFQQNHEWRIPGGVSPKSYRILKRLCRQLEKQKALSISYAVKNGKPEAGILIARSSRKAVYLFNASSYRFRAKNGRTWLLDAFFRKNTGFELIFDFESPETETIAGHYLSFGSTPVSYLHIYANRLPLFFKVTQSLRKRFASRFMAPRKA